MTKLEWCRANAPEAYKDYTDRELLKVMRSVLENPAIVKPDFDDEDAYERLLSKMDRMVLKLVRTYGDKLAFKGGYMLSKLLPEDARQTTDIDFSIQNSDLYKDLLRSFEEIAEEFIAEGFIAKYVIKPEVKEHCSGGLDMYSDTGKKVLGVDVGWHDITFGTTTVNVKVADVKAFTIERMLTDKITATLTRKRFRRAKDVYDIYCLTNCFDFSAVTVNDYLAKKEDAVEWDNFPFSEEILTEYKKAYDKLNLTAVTEVPKPKPSFSDVIDRFYHIGWKLLEPDFNMKWNHATRMFESGC